MTRLYWSCALLLAAAWLWPLHVPPWVSWHSEALATLAILLGCAGALWLQRRAPRPVLVPTAALLPAFIAACALLQWLVAGRIAYAGSFWTIASYAVFCAAAAALGYAAVGAQPADGPVPALEVFARLLVFAALAQLAVVFGQTLYLFEGSPWVARVIYVTRSGGNMAQPNQAAQLFVMAIAATGYLWQVRRVGTGVTVAALLVLALGLATTQSRSGIASLVLLVGWHLLRGRALPRGAALLPAAGYLAVAVLLFAAWYPLASAYWAMPSGEVNLTTSGRSEMWRQFLQAVQLRPWFGWGVMQVVEAQNAVAHAYPAVMASTFAHNLFLDLALWIGVPALLLVLALLAKWAWPRLAEARTADTAFCVALVLPFAVQAMTEFPYAYTYFLLPAFFAVGAFDALAGRSAGLRLPRRVAIGGLVLWAGASAWAMAEYVQVEEDFRVARFEALRVGATPPSHDVPTVHVLTQLDALLRATRVQPTPGMSAEDIALLRNVAMLHPWSFTTFRYALALALNGQTDEALRQLQVLRAMHGPKSYAAVLAALDELSQRHPVLKQLRLP